MPGKAIYSQRLPLEIQHTFQKCALKDYRKKALRKPMIQYSTSPLSSALYPPWRPSSTSRKFPDDRIDGTIPRTLLPPQRSPPPSHLRTWRWKNGPGWAAPPDSISGVGQEDVEGPLQHASARKKGDDFPQNDVFSFRDCGLDKGVLL